MNRHERRRQAVMDRQTNFHNQYVRHLPEVGPEALGTPGATIHAAYFHDSWCKIYDEGSNGLASCNCNPDVKLFAEPRRS